MLAAKILFVVATLNLLFLAVGSGSTCCAFILAKLRRGACYRIPSFPSPRPCPQILLF